MRNTKHLRHHGDSSMVAVIVHTEENGADEIPAEDIARLAYSYWEERNGEGGSPEEDWYRAERELRERAERSLAAKS